jgi:hypothetical protein
VDDFRVGGLPEAGCGLEAGAPDLRRRVIVYECEVLFLIPCGSAIVQANSPREDSQEQYAVAALIPGPARVTRTCFAAPMAAATDAGMGAPEAVASLKRTLTCRAETAAAGAGPVRAGRLGPSNLAHLPPS